ncbi:MAG TPA: NAD-dependent epimerase/dehydratase family protein [bacterium]|nr:NAD-dependent epimerase/dehydratase family protein [bacterium]
MALNGPVLITGVSGFIGTHLAERILRDGVRVRGLDIVPQENGPRIDFHRGDLTDPASLRAAVRNCEIVFHLAKWTGRPWTWQASSAIDVAGTANLLEACRQSDVRRVVHLSSIVVYGPTHRAVITEQDALWPVGAYGTGKVGAERSVDSAVHRGLRVVTLRSGQAYGPRAPGGTVTPIRWLQAGRPLLVNGGLGITHPIYIEHLLDALLLAAARDGIEGEAFNVADGNVTWKEFLGYYGRMSRRPLRSFPAALLWCLALGSELWSLLGGRPPKLDRGSVAYMTRRSHFSTEKARARLGWAPAVSMNQAMVETERWLKDAGLLPQ